MGDLPYYRERMAAVRRAVEKHCQETGEERRYVYLPRDKDILTAQLEAHGLTWDDVPGHEAPVEDPNG